MDVDVSGIGGHVPRGSHVRPSQAGAAAVLTADQADAIGRLMQAMLGDPPPDGMPYLHTFQPPPVEYDPDDSA